MNYELAKELKDAGFPQGEGNLVFKETLLNPSAGYCYAPTLSELIEACGKEFYSVNRNVKGDWSAHGMLYGRLRHLENGSTPEEAVSRLWIALNKNL